MAKQVFRSLLLLVMIVVLLSLLSACGHEHAYGEWMVEKQATCTENGSKVRVCECGEKEIETIPSSGHTDGEWITDVEATCTTSGSKRQVCSVCTESIKTDSIDAKGHKNGEWITDVEATCTEKGSKHQICSVCETTLKTDDIPISSHIEFIDKAVSPTCTETGLTEGKHCSACNTTLVAQKAIDETGHKNVAWITDIEATCTEKGSKHQVCSVCSTTIKTEEIPAKGHVEVTDKAIASTCLNTGLTEGKHCSRCNTTLVTQTTTAAKGHTNGNWITDIEPTCTEKGSKHQICSVCTMTIKTEEISAKGHAEVTDRAVSATCIDTGLTEGKHCSRCNVILVAQTTVAAKGHSYNNRICSTCYAHQPSEGLKFTLHSNGKGYVVTGMGSCTDEHLVIPETYNGKPVVEIGPAAFEKNTRIKTVIVSNTVTSIRYDAFSNCSSLTSIVIPKNVTSVQSYAFFNCTALRHIYCETTYESPWGYPEGWSVYWNDYCTASVHWINEWHYVKGVPTVK